ncbi:MAG: single-stranded-DNA-specific exonuclease RecJ [Candidatus Gastranaerophilales bacterium]|nr:single-stranded-DNA-specific exonuclease RecJ [Candidatus Gastranaerophilales bacterium]
MQKKWDIQENKSFDKKIVDIAGDEIIARILANRGVDTLKKLDKFMHPLEFEFSSPYLFKDMKKAVERIKIAIEQSQNIVIYGDFDCDGVTSTALLYKTLVKIGAKAGCYIPDRSSENHGLNSKAVCEIISKQRAKLIITVDNGISNNAEIKLAQSFGCDVILTDHHEPSGSVPEAYCILNPKYSECLIDDIEFEQVEDLRNLAGVGVAYKLACAVLDEFKLQQFAKELLYIVTIGTIADVMPILGENRAIVAQGLECIKTYKPKSILQLLSSMTKDIEKTDSETIAYFIAPRINAAGRLAHANTALELLVSEDKEKIEFAVMEVNRLNNLRQQMCDTALNEALIKLDKSNMLKKNKAVILADKIWHVGIIGLLASKLAEMFNRPVFIMSIDENENLAKCSIRGVKGFNVYETLQQLDGIFESYGGHALAGGFVADLSKITVKDLSQKILDAANKSASDEFLSPKISIDAIVKPENLTVDFINKLAILEPYGQNNNQCVFGMEDLVLKKFDTIGANAHLKMFFSSKNGEIFEGLIWNKNEHPVNLLDKVDLTFVPKINTFNDKTSVQLNIKNIYIKNREVPSNFEEPNQTEESILIDHRKKTDYLKTLNSYLAAKDACVFVENPKILQQLTNYDKVKEKSVNRFSTQKCEELIILDTPCEAEVLNDIISNSKPQKIHVFNFNSNNLEPVDYIKTLSGMLKYSYNNNSGKLDIKKSLVFLSTSFNCLETCLNLLADTGVITLISIDGNLCEFEFLKAKPVNEILLSDLYSDFEVEFRSIADFRVDFSTLEITAVKDLILK